MKRILGILCLLILGAAVISAAEAPKPKNWTPPPYKIYAQALSDEIKASHPELLSVTFHGVPPGLHDVYTMFAGSYPDRIGNPDDDDDIMITKLGITIIDPRWHRKDAIKKFVMMLPLREASGESVGLLVLAYKLDPTKSEKDYYADSTALRDSLEQKIPSYAALYEAAK